MDKHFKFLNQCTKESLRINPPGPLTDQIKVLKDVEFDGVKYLKDSLIIFNIWGIHHNPEVWHEHSKFIPERFDPENKMFKTPSGEDRPQNSFVPFSTGSRKCLGYNFALMVIPIMVMNLMNKFDFEHVDEKCNDEDFLPIASVM